MSYTIKFSILKKIKLQFVLIVHCAGPIIHRNKNKSYTFYQIENKVKF